MKFFGAPLITTGGFTFDFTEKKTECKDEYFMTTRIGSLAFRDLANFFVGQMNRCVSPVAVRVHSRLLPTMFRRQIQMAKGASGLRDERAEPGRRQAHLSADDEVHGRVHQEAAKLFVRHL